MERMVSAFQRSCGWVPSTRQTPSVSTPAVTVIIPVYNRADALIRAVRSVQDQSITDWELLVVDDASTDDTCRRVDVVIVNNSRPSEGVLKNYAAEHKAPLELGELDPGVEAVLGPFWKSDIARHDRHRLAFAVWAVLSHKLMTKSPSTMMLG